MLNRNNVFIGIALGLLIPVVGLAVMMMLNEKLFPPIVDQIYLWAYKKKIETSFSFDDQTLYIFGVMINLIPFRYYRRHKWDETLRGIVLGTLVHAILYMTWKMAYPDFMLPG